MSKVWDNAVVQLHHGSALDMGFLADESVDCVVTSPPYWGLRDYGLEPSIWDAVEGCEHEWRDERLRRDRGAVHGANAKAGNTVAGVSGVETRQGSFCSFCPAWFGNLGLEPTPALYVQHLVQVFGEVWRVLKPWGSVWLNLGDSYAGSNNGSNDYRPDGTSISANHQKYQGQKPGIPNRFSKWQSDTQDSIQVSHNVKGRVAGLKPKDLVGIPWRVAFALQADGWWLRSEIIWAKKAPMPESVTDRPTRSHEQMFLLTKAAHYYYDATAVAELLDRPKEASRRTPARFGGANKWEKAQKQSRLHSGHEYTGTSTGTRNKRDVWLVGPQPMSWQFCRCGAVYTSTQYRKLAGGATPQCTATIENEQECGATAWGFADSQFVCLGCGAVYTKGEHKKLPRAAICGQCKKDDQWGSHFATFPEALVEPCILAGTSERGNCAECGKPWAREIERTGHQNRRQDAHVPNNSPTKVDSTGWSPVTVATGQWHPTCACGLEATIPPVVLDPFCGSGTTLLVAQKLGRHAIGIDQSEPYLTLAQKRLEDVPLPLVYVTRRGEGEI